MKFECCYLGFPYSFFNLLVLKNTAMHVVSLAVSDPSFRLSPELIDSPHFVDCFEKSAETYSKVSADFSQKLSK